MLSDFAISHFLLPVLWILWFALWIALSFGSKKGRRAETLLSRIVHFTLILGAILLLSIKGRSLGPLGRVALSDSSIFEVLGLSNVLCGLGFATWARLHLGRNWSGALLERRTDLVRTGPYRIVRHPIYFGILWAVFGTALAGGGIKGLLALALLATAYFRKIRMEERFLTDRFGEAWVQFRREVKMLIPFVF